MPNPVTQYSILLPNGTKFGPYQMPAEGMETVWTFPASMLAATPEGNKDA